MEHGGDIDNRTRASVPPTWLLWRHLGWAAPFSGDAGAPYQVSIVDGMLPHTCLPRTAHTRGAYCALRRTHAPAHTAWHHTAAPAHCATVLHTPSCYALVPYRPTLPAPHATGCLPLPPAHVAPHCTSHPAPTPFPPQLPPPPPLPVRLTRRLRRTRAGTAPPTVTAAGHVPDMV